MFYIWSHSLVVFSFCDIVVFPLTCSDALYELLDIDRRATAADIKRAYRSKSLLMHPDKINQRGQEVTDEDRANFQKMKNAYDVSCVYLSSVLFATVIPAAHCYTEDHGMRYYRLYHLYTYNVQYILHTNRNWKYFILW